MPESEAFAIATQQSHALGKSPKGYGTSEGRATAKAKYDTPKDDVKTADPKTKEASSLDGFSFRNPVVVEAFSDELIKIAGAMSSALQFAAKNPHGAMALGGGALGAVAGAARDPGSNPYTGVPGSRLRGAMVGGALGAGLGYGASKFMPKGQGTPDLGARLRQNVLPTQEGRITQLLQKSANLTALPAVTNPPPNPTGLTEVKSTIPNKPLSGKTPKYTKVHSAPTPTPAASHQPVSEPPPVRR